MSANIELQCQLHSKTRHEQIAHLSESLLIEFSTTFGDVMFAHHTAFHDCKTQVTKAVVCLAEFSMPR